MTASLSVPVRGLRALKVLVVDDSPVVRQVLCRILSADPSIAQVDTAANGRIALRKIARIDPDVVTLDLAMPGLDGLETLRRIMASSPRPVIMLSAYTCTGAEKTIRALELGALDFIQKPGGPLSRDIQAVAEALLLKVRAVARTHRRRRTQPELREPGPIGRGLAFEGPSPCGKVVAIGASTGGTEAIRQVLTALPADFPAGIVVVQHMPEGFTRAFAERLNQLCQIEVKEASHRDMVQPGRALIAPGHSHMVVRRQGPFAFVELNRLPAVSGHRPSVDVLFGSVAETFGPSATAVILTGMGRDGATGTRQVHDSGGSTIGQNGDSCVVYGMPRAAKVEGGVQVEVDIGTIADLVRARVRERGEEAADAAARPASWTTDAKRVVEDKPLTTDAKRVVEDKPLTTDAKRVVEDKLSQTSTSHE